MQGNCQHTIILVKLATGHHNFVSLAIGYPNFMFLPKNTTKMCLFVVGHWGYYNIIFDCLRRDNIGEMSILPFRSNHLSPSMSRTSTENHLSSFSIHPSSVFPDPNLGRRLLTARCTGAGDGGRGRRRDELRRQGTHQHPPLALLDCVEQPLRRLAASMRRP